MFDPSVYAARRSALTDALDGGLVVLLGNGPSPMNYAANLYPFRQDGSFRYYTGLDEPDLALTLDLDSGEATLYGREATMEDRVWDGERPSMGQRADAAGVPSVAPPAALAETIAAARSTGRTVHTLPPYRAEHRLWLAGLLGVDVSEVEASPALVDAVVAQRLVKTDAEVAEIEAALDILAEMHLAAMFMAQPGRTEHEVAAAMTGVAHSYGSHLSFPAIVTTRGEVPHHHASGHVLAAGDLLLHDAGCVAPGSGYAADITRCSPVGGTFTGRQRDIYALVLRAQTACIEACAPGVSFRDVHDLASRTLAAGLVDLGLLKGDIGEIVAAGAHALFFHHGLGHAMGLDVHDMEGLGEDRVGYADEATRSTQFGTKYLRFARALAPGHVMTVEPGLYFNKALIGLWKSENRHADLIDYAEAERWVGFGGVRIEDDILITDDGFRVLGPGIPKEIADVEEIVQAGMEEG
ncbi:aminopeptidase P family protein [Rubrivirga sp. IMCC45206]|uniref:aminopeptidase P family protein n=1 Tax=Rubrivirga sp. IMCC45206 TaxID=3391614 RepID=UPI00398F90C4